MAEVNTEPASDKGPEAKDVTLRSPPTPTQIDELLNPEAVSPILKPRSNPISLVEFPVPKHNVFEEEEVLHGDKTSGFKVKDAADKDTDDSYNPKDIEVKREAQKESIHPEKPVRSPTKDPNSPSSLPSYSSKVPPPKYPLFLSSKKSHVKDNQSLARSRVTLNMPSTDEWSETGSSFIDRRQFTRPFKHIHLPEVITNVPARSGYPLVQVPSPENYLNLQVRQ
eukprot:augustus_masked-scaffold_11-processed-gene-4.54-mRNA-1 protein AED:1.00 eAED:1.00 QI:0/0/0/0/1/1/2/0/223